MNIKLVEQSIPSSLTFAKSYERWLNYVNNVSVASTKYLVEPPCSKL